MSLQKEKASKRLNYEILKMKQYMQLNQISIKEVSNRSGVPSSMVWKLINKKSNHVTCLTFLMVAEAIGYEISITLKK